MRDGAALLGGSVWATAAAAARARRHGRRGDPPIRNLVISCQENRSFDSYFGFAPAVQRRGFGPPPGFSQRDASGGRHPVFHWTALRSADPAHSWAAAHVQYDGGRMDGFFKSSGNAALGVPAQLRRARRLLRPRRAAAGRRDRAPARPAHARLAQPRVRPRDADGSGPRRVRRAAPPRDGLSAISDLTDLFDLDRRAWMSAGGM